MAGVLLWQACSYGRCATGGCWSPTTGVLPPIRQFTIGGPWPVMAGVPWGVAGLLRCAMGGRCPPASDVCCALPPP
eukprot:scaffold106898_cov15-Tisochrysis_lutea.AAC.1